jgi:hypothetical protein
MQATFTMSALVNGWKNVHPEIWSQKTAVWPPGPPGTGVSAGFTGTFLPSGQNDVTSPGKFLISMNFHAPVTDPARSLHIELSRPQASNSSTGPSATT